MRIRRTHEQEMAAFWAKVDKSADREACWPWTGGTLVRGYGQVWLAGRKGYAHRVAYEDLRGPIPSGLVIDHLCFNPRCCNPWHMEPVTQSENTRRAFLAGRSGAAVNALKTHCKRGHVFDEANTYRTRKGGRFCRACIALRKAAS